MLLFRRLGAWIIGMAKKKKEKEKKKRLSQDSYDTKGLKSKSKILFIILL